MHRQAALQILTMCAIAAAAFAAAAQPPQSPALPPTLQVSLTFDDLPETGDLAPGMTRLGIAKAIIQALHDAHSPPVYGFLNAQAFEAEPWLVDVLQAWRDAGFLIGNHTYSHLDLNQTSLPAYERDITRNEPMLTKYMAGQPWHWFRFPFLYEGATLEKREALRTWLTKHGYRIAEVTLDFQDYAWNEPYARCEARHRARDVERLKQMYLDNAIEQIRVGRLRAHQVFGRDIAYVMLLHDGAIEAVMLPHLLDLLKSEGFQLVTLPEAEADPAYAIDAHVGSKGGGTMQEQMMFARKIDDLPYRDTPQKELDRMCQ
jgi:peptidoglycan/xylan/chitin deacetylase (PgdA/CDA1 family)